MRLNTIFSIVTLLFATAGTAQSYSRIITLDITTLVTVIGCGAASDEASPGSSGTPSIIYATTQANITVSQPSVSLPFPSVRATASKGPSSLSPNQGGGSIPLNSTSTLALPTTTSSLGDNSTTHITIPFSGTSLSFLNASNVSYNNDTLPRPSSTQILGVTTGGLLAPNATVGSVVSSIFSCNSFSFCNSTSLVLSSTASNLPIPPSSTSITLGPSSTTSSTSTPPSPTTTILTSPSITSSQSIPPSPAATDVSPPEATCSAVAHAGDTVVNIWTNLELNQADIKCAGLSKWTDSPTSLSITTGNGVEWVANHMYGFQLALTHPQELVCVRISIEKSGGPSDTPDCVFAPAIKPPSIPDPF